MGSTCMEDFFALGSSESGQRKHLPSGCQATLVASCWWVGEWEVGISQVKIPQSSLLFFLSQYSPDCYKPSVNFQSPDNFCLFALVLWWRTFWRSFLHCFCWRHSCYSFWEHLCLFQFLFLCMWPVISDRFCCFLCLIEIFKIFSSVLKFHNDVSLFVPIELGPLEFPLFLWNTFFFTVSLSE